MSTLRIKQLLAILSICVWSKCTGESVERRKKQCMSSFIGGVDDYFYLLDHPGVNLEHIITFQIADGCSKLFKAKKYLFSSCFKKTTMPLTPTTLQNVVGILLILITDLMRLNFLFTAYLLNRHIKCTKTIIIGEII